MIVGGQYYVRIGVGIISDLGIVYSKQYQDYQQGYDYNCFDVYFYGVLVFGFFFFCFFGFVNFLLDKKNIRKVC